MKYEIKKLTPFRLASIYSYDALGVGHNMYALMEFDVTDVRQKLRTTRKGGRNISFFAFLLSAIAKAIDENKELNHMRCGKRIFYFDEVDISTPVELELDGVSVPRLYIVRDAAKKTAEEITLEIENAKESWKKSGSVGDDDKWALRGVIIASVLPVWLFKYLIRRFSRNPLKVKERFGTTYVASITGFTNASGCLIPYFEGQNRPLAFAIGNVMKKPGIINSEIQIREYLSISIMINHDLVDGAPAARFVNRLKERIEKDFE